MPEPELWSTDVAMGARTGELHGWYRADEVGRLAGVSGDRIGQWARRGYIRSSRSSKSPRMYAYQDVAEAILVHYLVDEGVPRPFIRSTIEDLRKRYGDWPLQKAKLILGGDTTAPGRRVHYRIGKHVFDSTRTQQQLVSEDLASALVEVVGLLSQGGWAAQTVELHHVEVDPYRMSGRPAIRGRRMTVEDVVTIYGEAGGDRSVLRTDYGLSDEQITDAVRWWQATEQFSLAA